MRGDLLFSEYNIFDVLHSQEAQIEKEVARLPASDIESGDVAELTAAVVDRLSIDPLRLTKGAMSVEAEEAQVNVAGRWERDTEGYSEYYVPGVAVTYYVPYSGDRNLFRVQPSSFNVSPPHAHVTDTDVVFRYESPESDVEATRRQFDHDYSQLEWWVSNVRSDVERFNAELRPKVERYVLARIERVRKTQQGVGSLGIPIRARTSTAAAAAPSPSAPPVSRRRTPPKREVYDVALSFAGENRTYVEKVAVALQNRGVKVFYDEFQKAKLWGKNLVDHLAHIYREDARFVVMFTSEHYVTKAWPTHERQHAQSRALLAQSEYILPVRFDDTEVPGLTNTVSYQDARKITPEALADLIVEKVRG